MEGAHTDLLAHQPKKYIIVAHYKSSMKAISIATDQNN
jgi:hypothetical protein